MTHDPASLRHTPDPSEIPYLKAAAKQGNVPAVLGWMGHARSAGRLDDLGLMIDEIAKDFPEAALDAACAQMPYVPDLRSLRAAWLIAAAWDARGGGLGKDVSRDGARTMLQRIEAAKAELELGAQLDPASPLPHALMIEAANLHPQMGAPLARAAFQHATARHPTNLLALRKMLRAVGKKWGGSHEEQAEVARWVASRASPGSDALGGLFYAHVETWFYMRQFEKNPEGAKAYRTAPAVCAELDHALHAWLVAAYKPGPFSGRELHIAAFWYFVAQDVARLRPLLALLGSSVEKYPWFLVGDPAATLAKAYELAK